MIRIIALIKTVLLYILLSTAGITDTLAQVDLELCPTGFSQGLVTTGFVECYRTSGQRSTREQAELDRLAREAVCNATPNAEVTSSVIEATSSGRFFSRITCTVTREVPVGTVLCPDMSEEVYRAFDTLVCQYFGSAFGTAPEGQESLTELLSLCVAAPGGRVLQSRLDEIMDLNNTFFAPNVACAFTTRVTDNIECPFGFSEVDRDDNTIECTVNKRNFESLAEATTENASDKSICTDTTAGLGSVVSEATGATSNSLFFSTVDCEINIPRFGEFVDQTVIRACDASCTEEIEQVRACLNGGTIGGPGCLGSATQTVERKCNTGPNPKGLCPLIVTPPANVVPLLLLDDD